MQPTILIGGVGSIGERHLRCFLHTGRVQVEIVEPQEGLRARIAQQYGVKAYATWEPALAAAPLAAVIATPAPWHIPLAQQCVAQGLHVLIEKPLSTHEHGIEALALAAATHPVLVAVAYVLRHHPVLLGLGEQLQGPRWGKPLQAVVTSGQHFPTYRPAYREIYYNDRGTGGGAVQDALTHLLNAGEWLWGPIHRLVADAAHQSLPGVTVEDTAHVLARHGDMLASYALNQYQAPNESTWTVVCEHGTLRGELHSGRLSAMRDPANAWETFPLPSVERDALFVAQAHAFLDAIAEPARCPCTLAEGWQTLRTNLAVLTSWQEQRWVELPAIDA